MVSEILVNTDLSDGMTPCWRQAIISTSLILLLIEPSLTLWHQSKMADILQAAFRMHFFVNTNLCTSTNILSKYIPDGIIGKKSALDALMARCITGDKSNLLFIEPS